MSGENFIRPSEAKRSFSNDMDASTLRKSGEMISYLAVSIFDIGGVLTAYVVGMLDGNLNCKQKDNRSLMFPCSMTNISFGDFSYSVLAAKNLGEAAYENFLDHTFLSDRKTTIRQHLSTTGSGIMEEEPPETLRSRYGG
ncbi:hypothetical protein ACLOJK_017747 [Asimina triloba]